MLYTVQILREYGTLADNIAYAVKAVLEGDSTLSKGETVVEGGAEND